MSHELTICGVSRAVARRVTLLSIVGLVVTVTACGNAGGGEDGSVPTAAAGREPSAPHASTVATGSVAESPQPWTALGDALGVSVLSTNHRSEQELMEIEVAVADCMAAEGFPYVPYVDPFRVSRKAARAADRLAASEIEGFRLSTPFGNPELAESIAPPELKNTDPNAEYRLSLTEAGREAWMAAYWGTAQEQAQRGSDLGVPQSDFGEVAAGCLGEGQGDDVPVPRANVDMVTLESYMGEIVERAEADPRLIEAESEERRCLAQSGIGDGGESAVYKSITERLSVILGDKEIYSNAGDLDEWLAHYEIGAGVDRDALAALQADERRLAVLGITCFEVAYQVRLQVELEAEAAWIAENEGLITAFLAEQAAKAE